MKVTISTIIKYLVLVILNIILFISFSDVVILLASLFELFLLIFITNSCLKINKVFGNIVSFVLVALYGSNMLFYIFSTTYLTMMMLSNVKSIAALSVKLYLYIPLFMLGIVLSLLPVKSIKMNHNKTVSCILLITYVLLNTNYGIGLSPISGYYSLTTSYIKEYKNKKKIENLNYDKNEFLRNGIDDYISKNNSLGKNPNVIVIFTEGLSSNVIYDDRNIMPNTKKYLNESISFDNYYNHSSATYRALIGQLYSGFQYDHYDKNSLISIQQIMKENGYFTEFINVEPTNTVFVDYLNSFEFDSMISPNYYDVVWDKEAYEFLFNEAINLNDNINKPFFLSIYTYQTHVGCDSDDEKFEDGTSNVLNRFANNDAQFGLFMEKFKNSDLYDNTIIIYTTDHASYVDIDYYNTFKDYNRDFNFLDKIPFFIYHKNVKPKVIDVNGKNSIDFAPTVLDYLDISEPNYFLGTSLFGDGKAAYDFDYIYTYPGAYYSTYGSKISKVKKEQELIDDLAKYYSIARKE